MKVTLLEYTERAKEILIFTKLTRRIGETSLYSEICGWDEERKNSELEYALKTIRTPWRFVHYSFLIEGVTRAFTHQFVRHGVGTAFAQQSMRISDMGDFSFLDTTKGHPSVNKVIGYINHHYKEMVNDGIDAQDARGILPTNILTNIAFDANLQSLSEMMESRLCIRTQTEFQQVMLAIRDEVIKVHPWTQPVLLPFCLTMHSCKYPAFDDCPVKKSSNHLKGMSNDENAIAERSWERCVGSLKIQPK